MLTEIQLAMNATTFSSAPISGPYSPFNPGLFCNLHAKKRQAQRGISVQALHWVVAYGHCISKQGLCFFVMRNKDLPKGLSPRLLAKVQNLVVVTKPTHFGYLKVITAYKNSGASKAIRKKCDYLATPLTQDYGGY